MSMNIFRLVGDVCNLLAIIVLFRRIRRARNAQGISLRTQQLFLLVYVTRYTDLFTTFYGLYNSVMKVTYIVAHCIVIGLMIWHEPISSSYDRDLDNFPHWKFLVMPIAALATVIHYFYMPTYSSYYQPSLRILQLQELLWIFSILLEPVAILPQLQLLRRYRVIENLTGNYVLLRGLNRLFYIINWVYRSYYEAGYRHHYVVYACGVIQTLLYVDFFYYWIISKKEGNALSYGGEGDTEYYESNVNELRNYDNSLSLVDNDILRKRGKSETAEAEDEVEDSFL